MLYITFINKLNVTNIDTIILRVTLNYETYFVNDTYLQPLWYNSVNVATNYLWMRLTNSNEQDRGLYHRDDNVATWTQTMSRACLVVHLSNLNSEYHNRKQLIATQAFFLYKVSQIYQNIFKATAIHISWRLCSERYHFQLCCH